MTGWKTLDGQWRYRFNIGQLFVAVIFFIACNQNPKRDVKNINQQQLEEYVKFDQLPQDFKEFYLKFHTDSSFQKEHIVFPLEGLPDRADPQDFGNEAFYYTSDQWILHTLFDQNANRIFYLNMADIIIEERVFEAKYQLMIIRRFAKASGGWRLIYYGGLNKYKANE